MKKSLTLSVITDQLRLELQQVEIELRKYQQIIASSPIPTLICGPTYRIISVNRAFEKLSGYTFGEVSGKNPRILISNKTPPKIEKAFLQHFKDGTSYFTEEIINKKKNGTTYHAWTQFFPIKQDKKYIFYVLLSWDITDRIELQDQIRNLGKVHELILDSTDEGIYGLDLKGNVIFVNRAVARMFGYTVSEMLGKNMHSLIHYKDPSGRKLPITKCKHYNITLKTGKPFHSSEFVFWTKKGLPVQVELISNPIIDQEKTVGTVTTITDITERKRLEALKTEFFSMVGHELRTPITTVLLLSQTLQKKKMYPENKKTIDTIYYELTRLNSLISDLLDSSRLDTNKFNIKPQEIELEIFIKRSIGLLRLAIAKHTLVIKDLVKAKVAGDPHRLEQVMINLVSNAAKYSAPGTQITITSKIVGKHVQISVNDHGIGIPKKNLERIFDKYYQVQHNTNSNGFGLGLYITKEIIRKHKGKIWVESNENKGSTFSFTLPIIQ